MALKTTYGLGGYCENCDLSHNHPLHNILSEIEYEEEEVVETQALAEALTQLPEETLNALKQALGL